MLEHKLTLLGRKLKYLYKIQRFLSNSSPELNISYLCNPDNIPYIEQNIAKRKGVGDIKLVNELKSELDRMNESHSNFQIIRQNFYDELLKIPNDTHPDINNLGDEPKMIKLVNKKRVFDFKPLEFYEITKRLRLARTDQLGNVCGPKSYYFLGQLAQLESALINYFLRKLREKQFDLISVPDLLHRNTIESCGMNTRGERNQVCVHFIIKHIINEYSGLFSGLGRIQRRFMPFWYIRNGDCRILFKYSSERRGSSTTIVGCKSMFSCRNFQFSRRTWNIQVLTFCCQKSSIKRLYLGFMNSPK